MEGLQQKQHRTSRGITYNYYVSPITGKDTTKPALLILHGFPDGAMLWSKIAPYLNSLPNRLLIPDLLGYGGTDKPTDPKLYAFDAMSKDLTDLMDAEGINRVISTGHDWGSALAQRFYNFKADRVVALILLNVPYIIPNKDKHFDLDRSNEITKVVFGYPMYQYWYFFTAEDAPEVAGNNVERFWQAMHVAGATAMQDMFCVPGAFRSFLTGSGSQPQRSYASDEKLRNDWMNMISSGGFAAPFCWYHSMVQGYQSEAEKSIPDENIKINVPVLFIGCTEDNVCRPDMVNPGKDAGLLPDLTFETLESGHWCPYEKPAEVAELIKTFVLGKDHGVRW